MVSSCCGGVLEVADVVVVEVDVDEGAELAFGGEEVLLEVGVGGGELREDCVYGCAGDGDGLVAAGVAAQRGGDVDLHASPFSLSMWAIRISMASSSNFLLSSSVPVSRKELVVAALPFSTLVMM